MLYTQWLIYLPLSHCNDHYFYINFVIPIYEPPPPQNFDQSTPLYTHYNNTICTCYILL